MAMLTNLWKTKDSTWLQLEVCRDFQWGKCSRLDADCKFAHPSSSVEVREGRVTACYDFVKGRCKRTCPPCRYYHPLRHLKDQLFMNGRKYLALRNVIPRRMEANPAEIYVLPERPPLSADRPYLLGWHPTVHSFLPLPASIHVGLISPPFLSTLPEFNAQNLLSYQKLPANYPRINTELFSGRNNAAVPSSVLCNVDLASQQASMSAYYNHVLLGKQLLPSQNVKKF